MTRITGMTNKVGHSWDNIPDDLTLRNERWILLDTHSWVSSQPISEVPCVLCFRQCFENVYLLGRYHFFYMASGLTIILKVREDTVSQQRRIALPKSTINNLDSLSSEFLFCDSTFYAQVNWALFMVLCRSWTRGIVTKMLKFSLQLQTNDLSSQTQECPVLH